MDVLEKLRSEIYKLHLALPWGACASQLEMEANCKDEAYKEVIDIINRIQGSEDETDLDSEIALWLRDHGDFDTSQVIAMTARYFYYLGKGQR